MTRINKTQINALMQIMSYDGSGTIPASQWVNGLGRHTTRRATPPFCEEVTRKNAHAYPKRIQNAFKGNRVQMVIAIVNMRAANKAMGKED